MEFVLNYRAIVQIIWRVVIKQKSQWSKRAFSVIHTGIHLCSKHLPNKGSSICEFWPGWNNWGCKHDLSPSSQAQTSLSRSISIPSSLPPFSPALHASFTCTAPLCWHHNAWTASDPGMLGLLLFEEQPHRPSRDYVGCESDANKKKSGTVCPVKSWMPYFNW